MNHLDLFSGIGGFALAAREVWGNDYRCVGFCDTDKFCQAVLRKRFPEVPIWKDIRALTNTPCHVPYISQEEKTGKLEGCNELERCNSRMLAANTNSDRMQIRQHETRGYIRQQEASSSCAEGKIDLLTGGFPCQPFSHAGKRKGSKDDRYLWPEMLRVIQEFKPTWVIAENVAGLLSMAIPEGFSRMATQKALFGNKSEEIGSIPTVSGRIESDLRKSGYETLWLVIPACSVNAPHRRDRVWIIGHSEDTGKTEKREVLRKREGDKTSSNTIRIDRGYEPDATNPEHNGSLGAEGIRQDNSLQPESPPRGELPVNEPSGTGSLWQQKPGWDKDAPDSPGEGLEGDAGQGIQRGSRRPPWDNTGKPDWTIPWNEVAVATCDGRVDDGLPAGVDGLELSKPRHRVERLKALGNAIVPQVVMEIMKAIKEVDDD